ncbi:imidazolonepropionase-like amidohydrolase [Krasilnikovia cinnamomea]|uniref:Imidazolonepropionase-like amidohydrolase n=1 Tax=Krasilnikovia cinnamomea TaxID=349313 RepID=A0A4Q7ZEX7_9ACTN|nr:amidohydrolase [Krasilnikovia cinnamomea]RZU49238.1 imidazolonepropionase-like amidohydrolase [Krasilnikovia cinnamomea]
MNPGTEWLVAESLWWDGRLRHGEALELHDGVPVAAVPAARVPSGADRRRLPGTLLPGLCDAHAHSALVDLGAVRAGGIAAVWDLGGVPAAVAALADRAARPGSGLPRIRHAGPFLTAPGGYPSDRPWAPPGSWREVRSPADAAEAVGEAHAGGATLIKVTLHAGGPMPSPATLTALVDAAGGFGLPVVAHAEGPGTVAAAYRAGAGVLAHTPWTEALDAGLVRDCAARMTWISTLDIHGWGSPDPAQETAIGNLRAFLSQGGTVRYGTDLGNGPLPLAVNPRELRALQRAGMSPDDILTAMTAPAAEPCWIPGGLGLDPDTFADVLATARVVGPEVRPRE